MKYLCLVFIEEKKLDALSKSEMDALDDDSIACAVKGFQAALGPRAAER